MLKVLEEDFARIPGLLDGILDAPAPRVDPAPAASKPEPQSVQLGLF
jgi:hypothetical protein